MKSLHLAFVALVTLAAGPARAEPPAVSDGWVRESIPGQRVTAAYPVLTNGGAAACQITAVSSPAAARVEIHGHQHSDGQMRMRRVPTLAIAAGERLVFAPGGLHLMLMDLHRPLAAGEAITFTFVADSCGEFTARLPVARTR